MAQVTVNCCPTWAFDIMVRSVLVDGRRTLGNCDFWVDADGPWADVLSYSIPTSRWEGVGDALAQALLEQMKG